MKIIDKFFVAIITLLTLNITLSVAQNYSVPKATEKLSTMSAEELWNRGNTAYANDNFINAEKFYLEILNRGLYSTDLYYNIGNLYHKRGELGNSLLYYYRALRLSPSDEDVLYNIELAEAKTKDHIERIPALFIANWSRRFGALMSGTCWGILSLLFFGLLLAFSLQYIFSESLKGRKVGFWISFASLSLAILSTHYALKDREMSLNPKGAIVMSSSMSVKSSPNESATELFILHEGTKVRILTSHEEWCEVRIDDGKRGWVESDKIERI